MMTGCVKRLKQIVASDVELWQVNLDEYAKNVSLDGLSAQDHARAARMAFRPDALRCLATRHALRRVLATALSCSPGELVIRTDEHGKPRVLSHASLQFNVSHSGRLCVIALSTRESVGVDVEIVREITDADQLTRALFTDNERREWSGVVSAQSDAAFLTCWTRKEACLKALGIGLSVHAGEIDAGCADPVRTVSVPLGKHRCSATVYSIAIQCNAVAAVALATPEDALLARQFFQRS
ncbi:MAG: 4'-phosphopantetheinyl transferase family protein [Burkholderiales bacterium]